MLQGDVELQRFSVALNLKLHRVADECMRTNEIGELNFAVEWIDVITHLIQFILADGDDHIADAQARFCCGHVWLNIRHGNTPRLSSLSGKLAKLRLSGREETHSS